MATRWETLLQESNFETPEFEAGSVRSPRVDTSLDLDEGQTSGASYFGMAVLVLIVIIVAVVIAVTGSKTPMLPPTQEPVAALVNPMVFATEEEASEATETKRLVKEHAAARNAKSREGDARVHVKRAHNLWSTEETSIEEPFLHTEKGQSFSEFSETLDQGREYRAAEGPEPKYSGNIEPLKQDLKRRGLGLKDFADAYGVSVPDAMVDSWNAKPHESSAKTMHHNPDASEAEQRMLATEALQDIKTDIPEASAAALLREVMSARSEAQKLNIALPSLSDEQRKGLNFWSAKSGAAGTLAKTILSRF